MEFLPVKPESCASISEWRLRCESAGLVFPEELVQACAELEEKLRLTWPDSSTSSASIILLNSYFLTD